MITLAEQTLDTPLFTLNGQIHQAKCVKCYDADTIHVVIALHGVYTRFRCRLKGVDTAELRSKNSEEKAHAKAARDYVKSIILDKVITIHCYEFDKYGRLLVDVFTDNSSLSNTTKSINISHDLQHHAGGIPLDNTRQLHMNKHLIECGYAYVYDGGKRLNFAKWNTE